MLGGLSSFKEFLQNNQLWHVPQKLKSAAGVSIASRGIEVGLKQRFFPYHAKSLNYY